MLKLLETQLGYQEKADGGSKFGEWFSVNVKQDPAYETGAWCDMFLSWAANQTGQKDVVGQFAYTVEHAQWFQDHDAFTTKAKPGDLVFFDWAGGKSIAGIDHVGIVQSVDGGEIHTIEGNIDGGVATKKVRTMDDIVGFGDPAKVAEKKKAAKPLAGKAAPAKALDAGALDAKVEVKQAAMVPDPAALASSAPEAMGTVLIGGLVVATTAKKVRDLFKRS
ncbi:CHAP domain-containing protein [Bailinhaonella thermotolerans]|nr:CHAP domain-containing protein [Bailinhaonella thermotolerans]